MKSSKLLPLKDRTDKKKIASVCLQCVVWTAEVQDNATNVAALCDQRLDT